MKRARAAGPRTCRRSRSLLPSVPSQAGEGGEDGTAVNSADRGVTKAEGSLTSSSDLRRRSRTLVDHSDGTSMSGRVARWCQRQHRLSMMTVAFLGSSTSVFARPIRYAELAARHSAGRQVGVGALFSQFSKPEGSLLPHPAAKHGEATATRDRQGTARTGRSGHSAASPAARPHRMCLPSMKDEARASSRCSGHKWDSSVKG